MSIRAQARAGARAAFKAAGDAVVKVTVRLQPTTGTYDPVNDTTPKTWGFEKADLDAVEYDDVEGDETGRTSEARPELRRHSFVVLGEDLEVGGAEIRGEQEGEVEDAAGRTWQVFEVETDPTRSVWLFHCRR